MRGNFQHLFQYINLYPRMDINVLAAKTAMRLIYDSQNTNSPDLTLKT